MSADENNNDAWDAFGSSSDEDNDDADDGMKNGDNPIVVRSSVVVDDDDDNNNHISATSNTDNENVKADVSAVSLFLSQYFIQQNSQVKISNRKVAIPVETTNSVSVASATMTMLYTMLQQQRGMNVVSNIFSKSNDNKSEFGHYFDCIIWNDEWTLELETICENHLAPGGILLIKQRHKNNCQNDDKNSNNNNKIFPINSKMWILQEQQQQQQHKSLFATKFPFLIYSKIAIPVHDTICPWLPTSIQLIHDEQERINQATVLLSSFEIESSTMTSTSIQRAVSSLQNYGYCIIPRLLDPKQCTQWGQAVLETVHDAAKVLLQNENVDIYNPYTSQNEPQSYYELSMREDLRLDIRHGTALTNIRQQDASNGNETIIVSAKYTAAATATTITNKNNDNDNLQQQKQQQDLFLRGHKSILSIIQQTMNPKHPTNPNLHKGNVGRYNFNGSGPDGSFQDLRTSPVGGIVSFPKAAEQALHADTPHLFEHLSENLPAHYINVFTPGAKFDSQVGGTAFIHGSHTLQFTSTHDMDDPSTNIYPHIVRPCVTLGDVILFDCRVLHFGLANLSTNIERPMLYTNTTHAWFHDPKNWNDRKRIFK